MHKEEFESLAECADCGRTIDPALDFVFAMADDAFLCFDCAISRGGLYDAEEERWVVPPDVLPERPAQRAHRHAHP